MKMILATATALTMGGAALAYQTTTNDDMHPTTTATTSQTVVTIDPTVTLAPPVIWNDQQRALWQQHMAFMPPAWTAEQRADFTAMMALPPAQWTAEQRALWHARMAALPSTWTPAQRAAYEQQVAIYHSPWVAGSQSAMVGDRIVEPSNANPELDARGIAVISAAAFVPAGYNGVPAEAMGGPLEGADNSYPPCTASVTDNCIQLYERGVRASLASYDRATGGLDQRFVGMGGPLGEDEIGDNTAEDDGLDVDTKPDGTIDVDGDLDGDGDNDLE